MVRKIGGLTNSCYSLSVKSMKKQQLIICLVLLFLCGCTKKKQEEKYFHIPDSLMKACLFQKDSYWVYKNDSSGSIDCTYVETSPVLGQRTYKVDDQIYYFIDYFKIQLQSSLFYEFNLSGALGDNSFGIGCPFSAAMKGFSFGCSLGYTAFVLFNDTLTNHHGMNVYKCDQFPAYDGDKFIQMGAYSSFKVNNLLFERVGITRSLFNSLYNKLDTIDYYFSPGNGIVKIVFRVDTTETFNSSRSTFSWSLLRYKAIQ